MGKSKRRKKPLVTVLIVLLVLMLIPIPFGMKDGGSICLQAVLYSAWFYRTMPSPIPDGQGGFVTDENGEAKLGKFRGFWLEVPGFLDEGLTIIDTTRWVPVEPND
ncbi:MAG: hypothetical protein IKO51_05635 [Clostridia bacterium]|nr:hypothetical protein [Clostridia bacterium]